MKISYSMCVCNESKELYSLVSFLMTHKDPEDDIDIIVDSEHVSDSVRRVLKYFKKKVQVYERAFTDGDFSAHRNFQISKCTGDYIFILDPDELPQFKLISSIKTVLGPDIIAVPRINMCPGSSPAWLEKRKFTENEVGWINWPDYQLRLFKNNIGLKFDKTLHETISGSQDIKAIQADPKMALWHIKSVEKQDNRWNFDHSYTFPKKDNLYDSLM